MKISLFCNAGMSTSLVASKMKQYYDSIGKKYDVEAYDFSDLMDEGDESDVIVLAPQVSWAYDDTVKDYPDTKVMTLTLDEFGSMNGEVVGKRVDQFIETGK